ncbi:MAG: SDR family oxidoreductase [Hyphomicrobiales bacterium]|nr:SDR family oxidoreductase [Hyphomicrobiales bacterium]
MKDDRLAGRVAMVMGAGSVGPGWGNGKAAAVAYARAGARVIAVDIVAAAASEAAGLIRAEGGVADEYTADVTKAADVARVVAASIKTCGRIDILHNNVGVTRMGGPVELSEADWHDSLELNLSSIYLACKHVLPHMEAAGRGVITNISSLASIRYVGYPYFAYYATKAAVNQASVALALQYASKGIRVNAILPGLMDTPLIYQQISSQYSDTASMVAARHAACPTGRMGSGWDVAHAAVFLASDHAQYITGVCLPVDGGLSARAM